MKLSLTNLKSAFILALVFLSYNVLANNPTNYTYTPDSICVTLLSGESETTTVTVTNTGTNPITGTPNTVGSSMLALPFGADILGEYTNTLNAIDDYFTDYTLNASYTTDASQLESDLEGNQLILFPEWENGFVITQIAPTIQNYVNDGGSIIICGNNFANIENLGLFPQASFGGTVYGGNINIDDDSHPITQHLDGLGSMPATTQTYQIENSDPNFTTLMSIYGGAVCGFAPYGQGLVIWIGFDYDQTNPEINELISNAVQWAFESNIPSWMIIDPVDTFTINAGDSYSIDVTTDATGLLAGNYTSNFSIDTDDLDDPEITLPVKMIVEAAPIAGFTSPNMLSCTGEVQFFDDSENFPDSWAWNFGDGGTSDEQNPSHTYDMDGNYTVTLEVCNNIGCDDITFEDFIVVNTGANFCDTLIFNNGSQDLATCSGIIYDDGGPNGDYANGVNGTISVCSSGGVPIAIEVTQIQLENCCDFLTIYDGPNTGSSIIAQSGYGYYGYGNISPGDTFTSSGSCVTFTFTTDGSVTNPGFEVFFESVGGSGQAVADFEIATTDIYFNSPVEFTNTSTDSGLFTWDFGDGFGSDEENPSHNYTVPGVYEISLIAANCVSTDTSVVQTITIPEAPIVGAWSPDSICVTLLSGEMTTETVTIENIGQGIMLGTPSVGGGTGGNNILALYDDYYAYYSPFFDNMIASVNQFFTDYSLTVNDGADLNSFEDDLNQASVLILPLSVENYYIINPDIALMIQEFVDAGNTLILMANPAEIINSIGILEPVYNYGYYIGSNLEIVDTTHPITEYLTGTDIFSTQDIVVAYNFYEPDWQPFITSPYSTAITHGILPYGDGNIIYFGSLFQSIDLLSGELMASAIEYALSNSGGWLTYTPDNQVILNSTESTDFELTIDATDLLAGTYTTNFIISNNSIDNDEVTIPVKLIVEAFPIAEINATETLTCDGTVQFEDNSENIPTSWDWDFGDNTTSTEQNPTHTYADEGMYTVTLTVCNDLGCDTETLTNFITFDSEATTCFTTDFPSGNTLLNDCSGLIYDNGGESGSYTNNFNGTITIQPSIGLDVTITINQLQLELCCDFVTIFDGPDINSPILGQTGYGYYGYYGLQAGDTFTSTGDAITIQFTTDGSVTQAGFEIEFECTPANIPPQAAYNVNVLNACPGQVQFVDETFAFPTTWAWDFGDGNTSSEESPIYTYLLGGDYDVQLIVTNDFGSDSITQTINIADDLDITLIQPSTAIEGIPVGFAFSGIDNVSQILWSFGDGFTSQLNNPSYTYVNTGVFTVDLTVITEADCIYEFTSSITVSEAVGIDEDILNAISVYPVPANQTLTIDLGEAQTKLIQLEIINSLGQVMYSNTDLNSSMLQVEVDKWSVGQYVINFKTENIQQSEKIIIRR